MPEWHHGSEVEALIRAGVEPVFHRLESSLEPDELELESAGRPGHPRVVPGALPRLPPGRAPLAGLVRPARAAADRGRGPGMAGVVAVNARRLVGRPVAVLPVQDVRVPGWRRGHRVPGHRRGLPERPPPGRARRARQAACRVDRAGTPAAAGPVGPSHRRNVRPGAGLRPRRRHRGSPRDHLAASGVSAAGIAARRRRHYEQLLGALGHVVPPAFARVPAGASPFAFPIAVDDKAAVLEKLARHGVVGEKLWSARHPAVPEGEFGLAQSLRDRIVVLPVHQVCPARPRGADRRSCR